MASNRAHGPWRVPSIVLSLLVPTAALAVMVWPLGAASTMLSFVSRQPIAPSSQPPEHLSRIGYLGSFGPDWPAPLGPPRVEEFLRGLREQGYAPGQSVTIEYRFANGNFERLAG